MDFSAIAYCILSSIELNLPLLYSLFEKKKKKNVDKIEIYIGNTAFINTKFERKFLLPNQIKFLILEFLHFHLLIFQTLIYLICIQIIRVANTYHLFTFL